MAPLRRDRYQPAHPAPLLSLPPRASPQNGCAGGGGQSAESRDVGGSETAFFPQGGGDVIADAIERIGGDPDLLDLGAGGIQFRPLQCGLPYLVLCYGECGRRKSCKCTCAVEQDAGIDSVVDQAAFHCLSGYIAGRATSEKYSGAVAQRMISIAIEGTSTPTSSSVRPIRPPSCAMRRRNRKSGGNVTLTVDSGGAVPLAKKMTFLNEFIGSVHRLAASLIVVHRDGPAPLDCS